MILYNPTVSGSLLITGSLTTTGTLTAQTLVVQTITSSVDFVTGSSVNGSLSSNTHQFTGSVLMSGSVGIGATPSAWISTAKVLQLNNTATLFAPSSEAILGNNIFVDSTDNNKYITTNFASMYRQVDGKHLFYSAASGTAGNTISFGTPKLTISSDGNIGIGVTPSAFSTYKALQIGAYSSLVGQHNDTRAWLSNNAYFDGTNWKYIVNGPCVQYNLYDGEHRFNIASSGTANNNISFTQALTITSSGSVGIGTSTPSDKLQVTTTSGNGITITTNDVSTLKMNNTGGTTKNWGFATTNIAASDFGIYQSTSVGGDPISAGIRRLYFNGTGNVTITAPNHMQLTIKSSTSGDARFEMGAEDNVVIGFQMATTANDITWFTGRHRPGSAGITDEMNVYRGQTNLHRIQNNGNYSFAGSNVSDIRLKENIQIINYNATEKLQQLIPVSYNMIEHPTIHKSGFIAQEVKEVLPNFVTGNESEDEHLGVDYNGILALAVKAIQELKAEIDTLKQQ